MHDMKAVVLISLTLVAGSIPSLGKELPKNGKIEWKLVTPRGPAQGALFTDDGDSFSIGPTWVRLIGVDAPEKTRGCGNFDEETLRCGERAEDELLDLLMDGVTCNAGDARDDRNRWLAKCFTATGLDIGREMVLRGWACAATKYSREYLNAEIEARQNQRGLWAVWYDYRYSEQCREGR